MGDWTSFEFGRDIVPKRCYLFAGDVPEDRKNAILSFYEEVEFHKHTVYERYIVSNGDNKDLLLFQVYGASTISDLSYILKDAGVEEIIFIGTAYGIKKGIEIGSYIVPNKIQSLEGLLKIVFDVEYAKPNELITEKLKNILDKEEEHYLEGKTISVPCTFFHPNSDRYDIDAIALEMEFSTICYMSEILKMKCSGVLIISDNEEHTLLDDRTLLYNKWIKLFKILKTNLEEL